MEEQQQKTIVFTFRAEATLLYLYIIHYQSAAESSTYRSWLPNTEEEEE